MAKIRISKVKIKYQIQKKNVLHIMNMSLIYKELLEIDKTKTNNPRGKVSSEYEQGIYRKYIMVLNT